MWWCPQEKEPARGAAMDSKNKEIWTVFLLNAFAVPAVVYLLVANTFHLDADSRVVLATVVEMSGVALTIWRWWSAVRKNLET
jgi:hypothetical protein